MILKSVLTLITALTLFSNSSWANDIYVVQSGDGLSLEVQQRSQDNYVDVTITGDNNDATIRQGIHADNTYDNDETGGHDAYWYIYGQDNTVSSYQTDTNRSGGGGDYHYLNNYIDGDSNTITHTQMGKAGHTGWIDVYGDSNTVDLYQRGNGGQKNADIVLTGDGHNVDVNQRGSNSAAATVYLTNSGGAYDFTLTQNVTTSAGSYSITGSCANANGCSVSVNGNN